MLTEAYADRQQMQVALKLARDVQRAPLPDTPPATDAVDIAAYLAPAAEVGGDLYDYFEIDAQRVGFAVGDVSGKGMAAALQMASAQTLLRGFGRQGMTPARCLDLINQTDRYLGRKTRVSDAEAASIAKRWGGEVDAVVGKGLEITSPRSNEAQPPEVDKGGIGLIGTGRAQDSTRPRQAKPRYSPLVGTPDDGPQNASLRAGGRFVWSAGPSRRGNGPTEP